MSEFILCSGMWLHQLASGPLLPGVGTAQRWGRQRAGSDLGCFARIWFPLPPSPLTLYLGGFFSVDLHGAGNRHSQIHFQEDSSVSSTSRIKAAESTKSLMEK